MVTIVVTYVLLGFYIGVMAAPRGTTAEDVIYRGTLATLWPIGLLFVVFAIPASAVGIACQWIRRRYGC